MRLVLVSGLLASGVDTPTVAESTLGRRKTPTCLNVGAIPKKQNSRFARCNREDKLMSIKTVK